MTYRKALCWICSAALAVLLAIPAFSQAGRGKAELKAGSGNITVDYGRPQLKGRDMISELKDGSFWRMGRNEATVLKTPTDLKFGSTTVPKGSYSLWLKKEGDKFMLVFNSQTGQWGTMHDPSKDVYSVEMKKASLPNSMETFTIDLKQASNGGDFVMSWGKTELSVPFEVGS